MIKRQFFDKESSTYTYLIADKQSREACLIDPVIENIDHYIQLLNELDLTLKIGLDTHIHADHVTALGELKNRTACETYVGNPGEVACATKGLQDNMRFNLGPISIKAIYTPGHTQDSYCFYIDHNGQYLFTGDTLLIRGTGRTDFQNGDAGLLYESLHNNILLLPEHTVVYPGHDYKGWTQSTILEEKKFNPRIQISDKKAFIEHMNNLNLQEPKKMNIAVPMNLQCGKGEH